ncbi:MAG: H-type lectin domain-containing protein [Magnetococcales bacterium]|nr:H-type lectin domain-containing protein [Magnetococcales bacterium]MBF0323117.1 H-type lectin domain-containing protein [Magnetococcales bacterium]
MTPVNKILLALLAILLLGFGGSLLLQQESASPGTIFSRWVGASQVTPAWEQKLADVQSRQESLQQQTLQMQQQIPSQLIQRLTAAEESLSLLKKSSGGLLRLEGGSVQTSIQNMEWRLADIISGRREFRSEVTFSTPFTVPPRVVLGITRLEVAEGQPRFGVTAQQVEVGKFVLVFETRAETRIREAQVDWLAFGP